LVFYSSGQEFHQKRVNVEFRDVSVTIGKKDILHSVYGAASAGQILAILGPSGTIIIIIIIIIERRFKFWIRN